MKFLIFISSISISLLLSVSNSFSVTVGFSCLEKKEEKQSKILLIFDSHDKDDSSLAKQHRTELQNLIDSLKKSKTECSFYLEFPYKTKNFKGTYDFSTIHLPIKDALAHNMNNGSIEYKPFDERGEIDFWIREMMNNTEGVQQAIENNFPIPQEFKITSLDASIKNINEKKEASEKLIDSLPIEFKESLLPKIAVLKKAQETIIEEASKNGIKANDHFLKLAQSLNSNPINKKTIEALLLNAHGIESDLSLLKLVISEKKPVVVVHAGSFHMQNLEKTLVASGLWQTISSSKNFKVEDDLSNFLVAKNLTSSFKSPVYEFLSFCDQCGKDASNKCSGCKKTCYCGLDCQKTAWQNHKLLCKKN